jgi:hypothetical protein
MNQTISLHSQSLVGRRVSEINESGIHRLPACIARLIEDCCEPNPDDRIQDTPTLLERLELARTIVSRPATPTETGTGERKTRRSTVEAARQRKRKLGSPEEAPPTTPDPGPA